MGDSDMHAGAGGDTAPPPGTAEDGRGFPSDLGAGSELERSLAAERAARSLAGRAEEWLDRLRTAAAEALTTISLDAVIRESLAEIAHNLGVDAAAVLIASDDGSELVARTSVGLVQDVEVRVHIPSGAGFAGTILASGEPLIVDDVNSFPIYSPTLSESGLNSLVGVPLVAGGEVLGVMHAGSKQPARFTAKEQALLEMLAHPIAAAIGRVRLLESERRLRQAAEITANRLASLQLITNALASARSVTEVCQIVVDQAVAGTHAEGGAPGIWMLREGVLRRIAGTSDSAGYEELPLDDSMPAFSHMQGAEPLFVESREELVSRWPALAPSGACSFAGFALMVGGRRLGVMAIGYSEDHRFDEQERAYLTALSEQASVALERAQAAEAEDAAQQRQAFLAETSFALTSRYVSPLQLLETLVHLTVPRLADWCTVMLDRGGRFERVAVAHDLESLSDRAVEMLEQPVAGGHSRLASRVFTSGRPIVLGGAGEPGVDQETLGEAGRLLGVTSVMIVPLESHGRAVGVMVFAACGRHPRYRSEDLELAQKLAERAGGLVEELTLRARERSLAETLTRALLPARLPAHPGFELVGRYVPAEAGPVGGDWYDAFELPGGLLGLVVGDVGGHGVEAASAMARLRNGLFAFASEGHDPAGIFSRLSGLLGSDSADWNMPDPIASVFFGALNRATLELRLTCAGHPPWLLLRGGRAEMQECGGRVLAGSLEAAPLESRHQLEPGDLCMFMTDGLVERPDEEMADSLERLREAAEASATEPLERLADRVLEATTPPRGRRDDCCLLALRIGG